MNERDLWNDGRPQLDCLPRRDLAGPNHPIQPHGVVVDDTTSAFAVEAHFRGEAVVVVERVDFRPGVADAEQAVAGVSEEHLIAAQATFDVLQPIGKLSAGLVQLDLQLRLRIERYGVVVKHVLVTGEPDVQAVEQQVDMVGWFVLGQDLILDFLRQVPKQERDRNFHCRLLII